MVNFSESLLSRISAVVSIIVISPLDYMIDESMTMIAACVGTGFPQPNISWYLDGSPLENSSRFIIYEEVMEVSGITFIQSFLEVCSVRADDHGTYSCVASNFASNDSVQFKVQVRLGTFKD